MTKQNLAAFINDSSELPINLEWAGANFEPGEEWALIFTAKNSDSDLDSDAVFQKASGAGIEIEGSVATVSLVPSDTESLSDGRLLFDIQAQSTITQKVRTVAYGELYVMRDITRGTETSVPVVTTETPLPFARTAVEIHAATAKVTIADADELGGADSEASWGLKKWSWSTIRATLKTYFDGLYSAVSHSHAWEAITGKPVLPYLNVKDAPYNAVGDGEEDDTLAIQAALDSAGLSRGIYLPAGTYKLTDTLVFKRGGTRVYGDGIRSTVLNQSVGSKHVFAWSGYDGTAPVADTQQCEISNLKMVGLGATVHTGSGIYARQDNGNFLTGIATIRNVWIEGFPNGIWAQSFWKLTCESSTLVNNMVGARLTKADTFLFSNCSIGASGVVGDTVGFFIEKSTGSPGGGNFGGLIQIGEYGDLDRFIDMTGGSVTVIEPNLERVGLGAGQCVARIQGYSSFRWQGGRIENGLGSSPQAFFRVRCSGDSPDPGTIPSIAINGLNAGAGGWRVVEFFGDLNYLGQATSTTGNLSVVYTATEAGTALNTTIAGPSPAVGLSGGIVPSSAMRGKSIFFPAPVANPQNDYAVVVAANKAGVYARRDTINDNAQKVLYSSAALLSSAAGAETTLLTYNIPAYAAADIGWEIRIRVVGRFANNTNAKRIRLSLDHPSFYQFYDSGSQAYQNSAFVIEGTYHVRAAAQNAMTAVCISDDALVMPKIQAPEAYSPSYEVAKDFKILTTGVAAADVKIHSVRIVAVKGSSEF